MGLLDSLTRADVHRCIQEAEFSRFLRPTAENLAAFLRAAGGDPDPAAVPGAQKILDRFAVAHAAVNREIERAIVEGSLTQAQRRAPGGPYEMLADLLADFLVEWGTAAPFGDDSLLAGLVFCELILATHNVKAELTQGENQLRGAVIRWYRAVIGEVEMKADDPRSSLQKAILGRFRTEVE